VDSLLSAAVGGEGVLDEAALRAELAGAVARLECMGAIQEKWRVQVEKMEEVEVEWRGQVGALSRSARSWWASWSSCRRTCARSRSWPRRPAWWRRRSGASAGGRARHGRAAARAGQAEEGGARGPHVHPPHGAGRVPSAEFEDPYPLGLGLEVSPGMLLPEAHPAGLDDEPAMLLDAGSEDHLHPLHEAAGEAGVGGLPLGRPRSEQRSPPLLSPCAGSGGGKALEDAGALAELIEAGAAAEELQERRVAAGETSEAGPGPSAPESVARLGQEMGTLRREVLELRVKLADMRGQAAALEAAKREADMRSAFGPRVPAAGGQRPRQVRGADCHGHAARPGGQPEGARERQAAVCAPGGHRQPAEGAPGAGEEQRVHVQQVQDREEGDRGGEGGPAAAGEVCGSEGGAGGEGRQKSKTKAAADAARPRLAELRDGAAQEEEVLAELERELAEARQRTEEAEKMHAMVGAMREKERAVREHVERARVRRGAGQAGEAETHEAAGGGAEADGAGAGARAGGGGEGAQGEGAGGGGGGGAHQRAAGHGGRHPRRAGGQDAARARGGPPVPAPHGPGAGLRPAAAGAAGAQAAGGAGVAREAQGAGGPQGHARAAQSGRSPPCSRAASACRSSFRCATPLLPALCTGQRQEAGQHASMLPG